MKIHTAEFVRSVGADSPLPDPRVPQVSLIGRSNVGKSTLINALARRKIARAGGAPGTTRLLNVYRIVLARRRGELLLIDEVLTPDSSRFWPADQYQAGRGQPSFDKQFVRDWLAETGWDKNSTPPALPDDVVAKTREKYIQAYEQLTGRKFG